MKKKILGMLVSMLFILSVTAQQNILEKYNLPAYNCDSTYYVNHFLKSKKLIVFPDDTTGLSSFIDFTIQNILADEREHRIKFESQLTDEDYKNALLLIGVINNYKNWDKFQVPIKQILNGFSIGNLKFNDSKDGFTYITDSLSIPARVIISGNSNEAVKNTTLLMYPIFFGFNFVENNDKVVNFFGNYPDRIVDIRYVKKDHYNIIETDYYLFHLSKNIDNEKLAELEKSFPLFDKHVKAFVKKMQLEYPKEKIKTFVHADQVEISYASGFLAGACYGSLWGFENGGEIHGYRNTGTVMHESNHYIFAQVNAHAPVFLMEGVQTYYENYQTPELRKSGLKKAVDAIDEDLTNVITTGNGFFTYDSKYYKISGIFVEYLIEEYGLDKFKDLYSYDMHKAQKAYKDVYGRSLKDISAEYKEWLKNKQ